MNKQMGKNENGGLNTIYSSGISVANSVGTKDSVNIDSVNVDTFGFDSTSVACD